MVINELDADLNNNFFLPRFREAVEWFSTIFDSLDNGLPRSSPHRHNCERLYFARDIINVVACEGLARTVRAERLEAWQRRLERLGFQRMPFSEATVRATRRVVRKDVETIPQVLGSILLPIFVTLPVDLPFRAHCAASFQAMPGMTITQETLLRSLRVHFFLTPSNKSLAVCACP